MTTRDGLPTMTTFTGRRFNFLTPDPESIDLYDIAHGLSQVCRFAAQSQVLYTVAQHSVLVSEMIKKSPHVERDRLFQKIALFHDAAEAYIGDMSSPLKKLMPLYKEIENRIQAAIWKRFHLPSYAMPKEVKEADIQILANEGMSFMSADWRDAAVDPDPQLGVFEAWEPKRAEREFLDRYEGLFS